MSATFSFTDNANGSLQTVALSGTGIASTEVSVTPDNVAFGTQTVGLTSAPVGIILTNTGNAVMAISKIAVSPASAVEFAQTNNCAATLGPKASCLINATFSAQQAGSWTGDNSAHRRCRPKPAGHFAERDLRNGFGVGRAAGTD